MSSVDVAATDAPVRTPVTRARPVRRYTADLSAVGEPALWALGGALVLALVLVVGFLVFIIWNGATTFWPKPLEVVTLTDGTMVAGEPTRENVYRVGEALLEGLPPPARAAIAAAEGYAHRVMYRIGNYDLYNEDFRWVSDFEVRGVETPRDLFYFERQEWGPFVGRIAGVALDGQAVPPEGLDRATLQAAQRAARGRWSEIRRIERSEIGAVNHQIERERLALRLGDMVFTLVPYTRDAAPERIELEAAGPLVSGGDN